MDRQSIMTIIFFVILVAIGFVWFQFGRSPAPTSAPTDQMPELSDVRRLREVKLDLSILKDARFTSLEEFSVGIDLTGLVAGRKNPFLPY